MHVDVFEDDDIMLKKCRNKKCVKNCYYIITCYLLDEEVIENFGFGE